jgi:hypothetical protein
MPSTADDNLDLVFHFHRKSDGRISVKSPGVPGLFLASDDLPALTRDLNVAVRDLLYYNKDIAVDGDIRWKPSEESAFAKVLALTPAKEDAADITGTCRVTIKAAE